MCGWDWTANRYPTAPMITLFMIKAASRAASLEEVVFMRFSIEKGCHLSSIVMKARAVPGADMRQNAASEAIFRGATFSRGRGQCPRTAHRTHAAIRWRTNQAGRGSKTRFDIHDEWHNRCCEFQKRSRSTLQGLTMLRMTGVSKAYRSDVLEIFALRDFSIHVDEGEFIAVTGPSGCGKTTFLTIAGMLDGFNDGEYELDGVKVDSMNDYERSQLRSAKIGFIFQSFNLLVDLTIRDNIDMPLRYRGLSAAQRQRRVEASLYRVGLSACAYDYPAQLSGGQQQRVAIARALAGSPRVLLADEPTANLDEKMAAEVMDLLHELHRDGATIVMVTHNAKMLRRAQREVRIVDGSIVPHPLLGP